MNQMEKVAAERGMSDANFLLDDLKDLLEDLRNSKEENLQMGLQLQEPSAKASKLKSLLDKQNGATGSMVDASIESFILSDDLICFPSKEADTIMSTDEEVCPGILTCGTFVKLPLCLFVLFCCIPITCLTKISTPSFYSLPFSVQLQIEADGHYF